MKSKEEIGREAAEIARDKILKSLKRHKVTPGRVAKRLSEALDAKEVKVFNDKKAGIVYSKPLVAHQIRLKAIELSSVLLDMKPATKVEFPDENGKPQKIGNVFTDMERATRLVYLLEQAAKRVEGDK